MLLPVFAMFGNETSVCSDLKAILLMAYELAGVFVAIEIFANHLFKSDTSRASSSNWMNGVLACLFMPLLLIFPSLLSYFSFLRKNVADAESLSGLITTLFYACLWSLLVFVPLLIKKVFCRIKKGDIAAIFLIMIFYGLFIFMFTFGSDNVGRWKIISYGAGAVYILINFYPARKRMILISGTLLVFLLVFFGTFVKFGFSGSYTIKNFLENFISYASLDDYFAGVKGIRLGLDAIEALPALSSFNCTLTDLFGQIPLVSRFFDAKGGSSLTFYQMFTHRTDNICPMIIQSIAHFGIIGAPILSIFFTFLALFFNSRLNKTKNYYLGFVFTNIIIYQSLFMCFDLQIEFIHFWVQLIFIAVTVIFGKIRPNKYAMTRKLLYRER